MTGKGPKFQQEFTPEGSVETPETTESTLAHHGVELEPERESELAQEAADSFGVDDRSNPDETDPGEQSNLFPDQPEGQETLDGETARNRPLFGDG